LQACGCPLRTTWSKARYRPALSGIYFPGQYLSKIKRPGAHYFRHAVLQEDYILWVLASVALSAKPLNHVAGLLCLLLSFWAIYECGYVDNDRIAYSFEREPTLTPAYHQASVATSFWRAWIWSLTFAVIGLYVIRWPIGPTLQDFIRWGAVLAGTYLWFHFYNRSNKPSRVWMYPVLQFARTAAIASLVPIVPIGAMAIAAHIQTRWAPYYMYRQGERSWPTEARFGIFRLFLFISLALLLGISSGWGAVVNWTALALLVWNLGQARHELRLAYLNFARIDRPFRKDSNSQ
jgi:hypothetical protein